ncbi:biotin--[acetyl-CoA-carboxylase] ligase [Pigmentiphaga soli]|uniref:biotin--[biotin carboxyl-carrier protein] ligase n=1 Tax=Pigmentiphaga soli TaxID=1007095 RepID=A0ABP8HCJ5_9BURK
MAASLSFVPGCIMSDTSTLTALPDPQDFAVLLARGLPGFGTVSWLDVTGSTNADVQQVLRGGAGDARAPILHGSHAQQAGRGRAGRSWQARAGDALLFSCGFRLGLPPAALPPLAVAAGVAACEALNALLPAGAQRLRLKWPNDIQRGDAKLAGILTETVSAPAGEGRGSGVVLGIGINLRGARELSAALGRDVADWAATGGGADPVALVAAVAEAWRQAADTFEVQGLAPFLPRFAAVDALAGRTVAVTDDGRPLLAGTASGIDAAGRLQLRNGQGLHTVTVGDVSVRSVEGGEQ